MTESDSRTADLGDQARQILGAAEGDISAAASSAARLVERAGTILEEELSVGITALDGLENRFVDVDRMRDPETHELLNRFRTDAHQIIDLVLDIVGTSFEAVERVADGGISLGVPFGSSDGSPKEGPVNGGTSGSVSVLDASETVEAGDTARLSMSVNNSADDPTEPFTLMASDLVSNEGGRIPADSVAFEPPSVTIPANSSERVEIVVAVPADVTPGTYAGLVQATQLGPARAVLTLTVT